MRADYFAFVYCVTFIFSSSWCHWQAMVIGLLFLGTLLFCRVVTVKCCPIITKTRLYNIDPLKSHVYIVKLGFTGVYIIFLNSAQKHRLWILVRTALPRRVGSNEYPQSMFLSRNMKNIKIFI